MNFFLYNKTNNDYEEVSYGNKKQCNPRCQNAWHPKMLLLGLQHMFAMFGATILVPILVNNYFKGEGLSIQVTLFCAGVGTLFFHLCTKLKVPLLFLVLRSPFSADLKPFPNWTPEFSKICPWAKKTALRLRWYRSSRCSVSGACTDYQKLVGVETCDAFSSTGCHRSDYYLHRLKFSTIRS